MRILIADDEPTSRRMLQRMLEKWGHEVLTAEDGELAWGIMQQEVPPDLVIMDWMMPGLDGTEICQKIRSSDLIKGAYVIMLSIRSDEEDVIEGLSAGADDYVKKPYSPAELRARIQVGERVLKLRGDLENRVGELEEALSKIQTLEGILPICSYCKRIRNDREYWEQVESYLSEHIGATFTHGICPECYDSYVKPSIERVRHQEKRLEIVKRRNGEEESSQ